MFENDSNLHCNSEWVFEADARTRTYALTIQYESELPPQEHDALHAWLHEQARRWMIGSGYDPAACTVTIRRSSHNSAVCAQGEALAQEAAQPQVVLQRHAGS